MPFTLHTQREAEQEASATNDDERVKVKRERESDDLYSLLARPANRPKSERAASEMAWEPLRFPDDFSPMMLTAFTRRFLSRHIGGCEQGVRCRVSKQKQSRTTIGLTNTTASTPSGTLICLPWPARMECATSSHAMTTTTATMMQPAPATAQPCSASSVSTNGAILAST